MIPIKSRLCYIITTRSILKKLNKKQKKKKGKKRSIEIEVQVFQIRMDRR